jgi:hypothetical protein
MLRPFISGTNIETLDAERAMAANAMVEDRSAMLQCQTNQEGAHSRITRMIIVISDVLLEK